MNIFLYIGRRLLFVIPQIFGIVLVSFLLFKTIPGDPAVLMLGPTATTEAINALRHSMGLDQSVASQFWIYFTNLLQGNLGTSWQTTRPVFDDLLLRFPATLELVALGLLLALIIGVPLGLLSALFPTSRLTKIADYYGIFSGSIPDFWLGLVLIFIFYTLAGIAPPPLGRIDLTIIPPPFVTGAYTIDSLIAGNFQAFRSAVSHLILPVMTLGIINASPIFKITQSTVLGIMQSGFSTYETLCGLPHHLVVRHALRNALPSVVTIVSVLFGFLLGGAVLVEIVFSWGGAGQYAVQGVLNSDIYPVLGFVIFAATLSLIVYLIVDLIYFAIDPRLRNK